MTKNVKALIVGGGPAGLSLAYSLGSDSLILEREERVGGLCRSIEVDGGVFDIGGHSFHTPHPEVADLLESLTPGGVFRQQRQATVFTNGVLIPYPFQQFFDRIPNPDIVEACARGLERVTESGPEPQNFEEYITRKFGQGIADHFMLPYNRKLWARDIRNISCEWTSERVAAPKGKDETFDTSGGSRKPLQPSTRVGYPQKGGFAEFFEAFVPHVPQVDLNTEVVSIDPVRKIAVASDGRTFSWECLVSTMPLPEIVRLVGIGPC